MQQSRVDRFQAFVWAVALHVAALMLLVVSLHFNRPQIITPPAAQVMNAVAVDQSKVEAEIKKLHEQDQKKQEQQKALEEKRKEEEKKIEELKQEKEKLKQQKEEEQTRLKEAEAQKQEQEKEKARIEAEKQKALAEKKQLEEEKKQAEEQKHKAETDKKRQEQEKKKAVEAQKRQEEEELEKQRREELEAEDRQRLNKEAQIYTDSVLGPHIGGFFINPAPGQGLTCKLFIRITPTGEVVEAKVSETSGVEAFDRQALAAVFKAQPLPVPEDPAVLKIMAGPGLIINYQPPN